MFVSGTITLIICNEEISDTMKVIISLEESGLLIKAVSEAIQNEAKENSGFLSIVLGTLGLLRTLLISKGSIRTGEETIREGEITVREGHNF